MKNRISGALCLIAAAAIGIGAAGSSSTKAVSDSKMNDLKVKRYYEDMPVMMWKADISRYGQTTLTAYETVGEEKSSTAYMPEGIIYIPDGVPLDCVEEDITEPPVESEQEPEAESDTEEAEKTGYFEFTTYGMGHGLGLSRKGAEYYALYGGCDYEDILQHYYPGTYIEDTEAAEEELLTVGDVTASALDIVSMVVYNEMSNSMSPEALKAQAVAAYSYIKYFGGSTNDLCLKCDPPETIREAVSEVLGKALYYEGEPVLAIFGPSSGGATASYKDIYGDDIPYLVSVPCEFDEKYSPYQGLTAKLSLKKVKAALENNLDITLSDDPENWIKVNEGDGGYAASVEIDGQLTIKGSDLRYYLGLKSNKYTVEYNSLP